jgi:putative MFS transporter
MPSKQRGWALVLVGGLGAAGGYLAASALSAWLVPLLSWRILWFLNLPTGLALIFLNVFIPESPKFLLALGRIREAHAVLQRFGCIVREGPSVASRPADVASVMVVPTAYLAQTVALSIVALAWGLINFGLLLWMPAHLVAKGYSMGVSSGLLAASALIAVPTVFVAAWLYSRWSSKGALVGAIALCGAGLLGLVHLELSSPQDASPVLVIALLIVGINGIIAMLLPYAAESYPLQVRGRATGWVAACTKAGGLAAQLLGLLGLVPGLAWAAVLALVPVLLALLLVVRYCAETRGRDLRDLEGQAG